MKVRQSDSLRRRNQGLVSIGKFRIFKDMQEDIAIMGIAPNGINRKIHDVTASIIRPRIQVHRHAPANNLVSIKSMPGFRKMRNDIAHMRDAKDERVPHFSSAAEKVVGIQIPRCPRGDGPWEESLWSQDVLRNFFILFLGWGRVSRRNSSAFY